MMYSNCVADQIVTILSNSGVNYESWYDESTGEYTFKFTNKRQLKKEYTQNDFYDDLLREQQEQM